MTRLLFTVLTGFKSFSRLAEIFPSQDHSAKFHKSELNLFVNQICTARLFELCGYSARLRNNSTFGNGQLKLLRDNTRLAQW